MRYFSTLINIATVLLLVTWATAALAADVPRASWCVEPKSQALLKQAGYSAGYICEGGATTFRFIGRIAGNSSAYLIYYFEYTFKAAVVRHGGQRLMVFDRKEKYLGQYALSATDLAVRGRFLCLSALGEGESGAVALIDFSNGPPPSIFFDGDVSEFDPNRLSEAK
jgi:hypothetical protein